VTWLGGRRKAPPGPEADLGSEAQSDVQLKGAVVAITGASAGIGWASALVLARHGARVALGARRRERLEQLAQRVQAAGGEALVQELDVVDAASMQRFLSATVQRFGRLDVLVNNAGYGLRASVESTSPDDYRRLMEVNFMGTVHGCQAALPFMRAQGRGLIINMSSIAGHRALAGGGAYSATKAAQISLTEALRVELSGSGITVCSVHPIGTATEFDEVASQASGGVRVRPVGPQQSAEDVAEALVRCVRRPRAEVYPHRASRLLVWLNALAPGLVDRLVLRAARRSGRL
jgi:NADP-dependent 3-hydroxy acid dehydrogenase YdfG